jgi:hypothetical protein
MSIIIIIIIIIIITARLFKRVNPWFPTVTFLPRQLLLFKFHVASEEATANTLQSPF